MYTWAGHHVGYDVAHTWQETLVSLRAQKKIPDYMLALEHMPTYTAGRTTRREHMPSEHATRDAAFFLTNRGGSVTYHGPGQLVGYPIVHSDTVKGDIHAYLRMIEEALIRTLADLRVAATRQPGYTGVWVDGAKIASIGIRVTRRVFMHGFALNVHPDLDAFAAIIPCGIEYCRMTSLKALGLSTPPLTEVAASVADHLRSVLGHSACRYIAVNTLRPIHLPDWVGSR